MKFSDDLAGSDGHSAPIIVRAGEQSYPVIITHNDFARLSELTRTAVGENRLFLLVDENVHELYGDRLYQPFSDFPLATVGVIPSGEGTKDLDTVQALYDFFLVNLVGRRDFIVVIGGGVATDVGGFTASTVLRGVRWAAIPTTLLGMIDAAIGGKTGVNHSVGKNLIGAFWHPTFVFTDLSFLSTLPPREFNAGVGEMAKYAGLIGSAFADPFERWFDSGSPADTDEFLELVHQSVAFKADLVSRDPDERDLRRHLNYGHTFAHAIETTLGYGTLLHGEAVIVGLLAAVHLAQIVALPGAETLSRYQLLLERLLTRVPKHSLDLDAVIGAMSADKKRVAEGLAFVLAAPLGSVHITSSVSNEQAREALERVLSTYGR